MLQETSHRWVSLGAVAQTIGFFKQHQVRTLVMAGKFERPSFKTLKVDWKGALWLAQLAKAGPLGDDGLLRFLAQKLEGEGFEIVAPQEILCPLLGEPGLLTHARPSREASEDIQHGFHVLHTLSPLDMGQAVVIQEGVILGVEGAEGTDALIRRCGLLQKDSTARGILVKGAKRGQDTRLDLPALGPHTIQAVREAGLQGIAFEAHRTILLEKEKMKALADEAGLFVVGIELLSSDGEKKT